MVSSATLFVFSASRPLSAYLTAVPEYRRDKYVAANRPVNPVAPKTITSYGRDDDGTTLVLCADVIFENFASLSLSFQKRARVCTRFTTLFDKKISPRPNERKRLLKRSCCCVVVVVFWRGDANRRLSFSKRSRVSKTCFFCDDGCCFLV